jgi:hypothetical protein
MGEKDRADAMFTLDELARTIGERAGARAETSYTRSLLDKGALEAAAVGLVSLFGRLPAHWRAVKSLWLQIPFPESSQCREGHL